MSGSSPTWRVIGLGVALLLSVAACGGSTAIDPGTDSDSPAPTEASVPPTAASTSTPPGTSVATTTSLTPAVATCDHLYFPAREGASWTFMSLDGETVIWKITSASPDGTEAVMEADLSSPEGIIKADVNLTCGDFGISAPELAFTGLPFGAEVTQVTEEGVFLPPADQLTEGATWDSVVLIAAELPGDILFEIRRTANFTVLGFEEVVVPAGTFSALKIRSAFVLDIDAAGRAIQSENVEILWFVEGVGLVKETSEVTEENEQPDFGNELVEYVVP
jgi:hypothetical protein